VAINFSTKLKLITNMALNFKNIFECAEAWAQQKQLEGKCGNKFYFSGDTVYSYGEHYPIAHIIYNTAGQRAYVINSDYYSQTTNRHRNAVICALPILTTVFYNSDACSPKVVNGELTEYKYAINFVLSKLDEISVLFVKQRRARTARYYDKMRDCIGQINDWLRFWDLNKKQVWTCTKSSQQIHEKDIFTLFQSGCLPIAIGAKQDAKTIRLCAKATELWKVLCKAGFISKNLSQTLFKTDIKDAMLNVVIWDSWCIDKTAQAIDKREREIHKTMEAEKTKREKHILIECVKNLHSWRNYQTDFWSPFNTSFYAKYGWDAALRVENDHILTSKGIGISFSECKQMWETLKRLENGAEFEKGHTITSRAKYTYGLSAYVNHKAIIGCHTIPFSECERIAKQLNW
jgi:hypothetical protein